MGGGHPDRLAVTAARVAVVRTGRAGRLPSVSAASEERIEAQRFGGRDISNERGAEH
jgi:hypothetical protein